MNTLSTNGQLSLRCWEYFPHNLEAQIDGDNICYWQVLPEAHAEPILLTLPAGKYRLRVTDGEKNTRWKHFKITPRGLAAYKAGKDFNWWCLGEMALGLLLFVILSALLLSDSGMFYSGVLDFPNSLTGKRLYLQVDR